MGYKELIRFGLILESLFHLILVIFKGQTLSPLESNLVLDSLLEVWENLFLFDPPKMHALVPVFIDPVNIMKLGLSPHRKSVE